MLEIRLFEGASDQFSGIKYDVTVNSIEGRLQ